MGEGLKMQFKRMFVDKILRGEKTQTRRLKIAWYKVGSIVPAQCGYREKAFAYLEITNIRREWLGRISEADIKKEGLNTMKEFVDKWVEINKEFNMNDLIYVIDFKLTDKGRRGE